jgi:hypothetical protein
VEWVKIPTWDGVGLLASIEKNNFSKESLIILDS